MTAHAKLGASSTKRWMTCPGSVSLIDSLPVKPAAGAAADLGSAAHGLGEYCLLNDAEPWEFLNEPHPLPEFADRYTVDTDMVDAVTVYTDHIRQLVASIPCHVDLNLAVEQRVNFDTDVVGGWAADMFGTADFIFFDEQNMTLYIRDYKHGAGEGVEVEGNTQMMYYAAAAASQVCAKYGRSRGFISNMTVDVGIIQPRKPHVNGPVRTCKVFGPDLLAWMIDVLKPAAEAARSADAGFAYSEGGCLFCPAKAVCKTYAKAVTDAAMLEFGQDTLGTPDTPVESMTPEQLAAILNARKAVTSWFDAVEEYVKWGLIQGNDVAGGQYKLVAGRSSRDWQDEQAAVKFLLSAGVPRESVVTEKVVSPAQAEKLVGKERKEELAKIISSTVGKPSLVPSSDKRQAITLSPEADFLH